MRTFQVKTIKYILGIAIFSSALILQVTVAQAAYTGNDLVVLTNDARSAKGLGVLTTNDKLASAAQAKAQDMLAKGYFAHNSPEGKTPWDFINAAGYTYTYAGENLAIGYTDQNELFSAWMNSPTHRENILNPNFREIGLAVVSGKFQGAETTVAVQEFGSRGTAVISPSPTPATSASPSGEQTPALTFIQEKSDINPKSIFVGEEVTIKVTLSGEAKTLEAEIFNQKYNILEAGTVSGSAPKEYILKQKIAKDGTSEVKIVGATQNGETQTLSLGDLEVKPTTIVKGEAANGSNSSGFLSRNWFIILLAIGLGLTVFLTYLAFRKNKLPSIAPSWRF